MNKKTKFSVITLGCPKNRVESGNYIKLLEKAGFEYSDEAAGTGFTIVNTCAFIDEAREESLEAVFEAVSLKEKGLTGKVIVSGCLAQRYYDELKKELKEADAVFGLFQQENLVKQIGKVLKGEFVSGSFEKKELGSRQVWDLPGMSGGVYAYIMISDGCSHRCSFCSIPSIRGEFRCRSSKSIIEQAEREAGRGARELVLIGNDVAGYRDGTQNGFSLSELIEQLDSIGGLRWIRLLYLHPDTLTEKTIDSIAGSKKTLPYFDIPFQHGSDRILKSMGRKNSAAKNLKLLEYIRKQIPEAVIRTSLITGYPGEGKKELEELAGFMREAAFDYSGIFRFSEEEGTRAASLKKKIPEKESIERFNQLVELADEISAEKWKARAGQDYDVLVESVSKEVSTGRFFGQAPEIDGQTFITQTGLEIGKYYRATIEYVDGYDLYGKLDSSEVLKDED